MSNTTKTPAWTDAALTVITSAAAETKNGKLDNAAVKSLLKDPVFEDKNLPSLRGKVVAMKLYQAADPAAKPAADGEKVARKMDYVKAIETCLSMPKDSLSTFEKASKAQLEALSAVIVKLGDKAQ